MSTVICTDQNIRINIEEFLQNPESFIGNRHISNWDVRQVTNMSGLFNSVEDFNENLNNWDVSNVTNMAFMFADAYSFNQPLNNWDVSNVTNMNYMFYNATSFNQNISNWNININANINNMYLNCPINEEFKAGLQQLQIQEQQRQRQWQRQRQRQRQQEELEQGQEERQELRRKQFKQQQESLATVQQYTETHVPDKSNYEECIICGEPLDNTSGPGTSDKCLNHCNDVVTVCKNNHMFHRGCILNSCNANPVNITGQMGFTEYVTNREQKRKNQCPVCTEPLEPPCEGLVTSTKVPESELPLKTSGGKRRFYKRKTNKRRTNKHRYRKRKTRKFIKRRSKN